MTDGAWMSIINGQSRETGKIGYTKPRKKPKKNHNTICVGHHYAQANTNSVNKTCALLQTTGGKIRTEHRVYAEIVTDITTPNSERKRHIIVQCKKTKQKKMSNTGTTKNRGSTQVPRW